MLQALLEQGAETETINDRMRYTGHKEFGGQKLALYNHRPIHKVTFPVCITRVSLFPLSDQSILCQYLLLHYFSIASNLSYLCTHLNEFMYPMVRAYSRI